MEEWRLSSPDDLASWAEAQYSRVAIGIGDQGSRTHASLARRSFLVDSCAAFARSLELRPDEPAVVMRLAYVLGQLGLHYVAYASKCGGTIVPEVATAGSSQGRLWEREIFEDAPREVTYAGLVERAEIAFTASDEHFKRTLAITVDARLIGKAYRDWGAVLFKRAQQKNGLPAEVLYHEASSKCENSLDHCPDTTECRNGSLELWSRCLEAQRRNQCHDDEARMKGPYMDDIKAQCLEVLHIQPLVQWERECKLKRDVEQELVALKH